MGHFVPPKMLPQQSDDVTQYDSAWHDPVLVDEVLAFLAVRPGGRYVDGTLGGGGHSHAILDASSPDGRLLAIDRDATAIEFAGERLSVFGDRVQFVHGNYGEVARHTAEFGEVDGFLVDAGVSSQQLNDPERGFSFRAGGPLDMRMGDDAPTLAEYFETVNEKELARVFRTYGEMKDAGRIAARVLEAFYRGELQSTSDLAGVLEKEGSGASRNTRIHPATLAFQALRIELNRELETLEDALRSIPDVVKSGGRAVFITFHSLEDRIVKRAFRGLSKLDVPKGVPMTDEQMRPPARLLTTKPVTASEEELERNPRARSAKLRAIEIL